MSKTLLGYTKPELYGARTAIYLEDFEWACGWYWSGGGISSKEMWCHFDGCFLDPPDPRGHPLGRFVSPWGEKPEGPHHVIQNGCSVWEPLETFLVDSPAHLKERWWRIKDLYKQFYRLRDAAEVFQYGGHCTSEGRNPAEISPHKARLINQHIELVIIPEIREALAK